MANWWNCRLWVNGEDGCIQQFLDALEPMRRLVEKTESGGYIINTFIPLPREVLDAFDGDVPDSPWDLGKDNRTHLLARYSEVRWEYPRDVETKLESREPGKLVFTFRTQGTNVPIRSFKHISQMWPQFVFDLRWELSPEIEYAVLMRFVNGDEELLEGSVNYGRVGRVLLSHNNSEGALQAFREDLSIIEFLAASDPSNTCWQKDLAMTHMSIGSIQYTQNDLTGALSSCRERLSILEQLTATNPSNPSWERQLASGYAMVSHILERQGDWRETLRMCQKSAEILKRLSEINPADADLQKELFMVYRIMGDSLLKQRDLGNALQASLRMQAILESLLASDPSNALWLENLSQSCDLIGDILEDQGDLSGALQAFQRSMEILERLAASDTSNTYLHEGLYLNYESIGRILEKQGDSAGALQTYKRSLNVLERLLASDPHNTDWQHNLIEIQMSIGDVLRDQDNVAGAMQAYQEAVAAAERVSVADPSNVDHQQRNLGLYVKMAQMCEQSGKGEAQSWWRKVCETAIGSKMPGVGVLEDEQLLEDLSHALSHECFPAIANPDYRGTGKVRTIDLGEGMEMDMISIPQGKFVDQEGLAQFMAQQYREEPRMTASFGDAQRQSDAGSRSCGTVHTVDLGAGVTIELVWIPPGEFIMGSPDSEPNRDGDEGPQHKVRITKGFWMGKYQVTQRQWEAVMQENPSHHQGEDNPVDTVYWKACQKFLRKASQITGGRFRLPTEAEWEYACRAGSTTAYCFGDALSLMDDYTWHPGNSEGKTHPVGQKKPNAWGLYDMHGNVWEWCEDVYDSEFYYKARAQRDDPRNMRKGKEEVRVLRGGSFMPMMNFNTRSMGGNCRSAARFARPITRTVMTIGFRVVFVQSR